MSESFPFMFFFFFFQFNKSTWKFFCFLKIPKSPYGPENRWWLEELVSWESLLIPGAGDHEVAARLPKKKNRKNKMNKEK